MTPGPSSRSFSPSLTTSAVPSSIAMNSYAKRPCSARCLPASTSTSSAARAICSRSCFESEAKSGISASLSAITRAFCHSDPGRHNADVFGPSVDNLVAQLSRLPGVGTRTAQRLAFHLLQVPKDEASALARSIDEVLRRVDANGVQEVVLATNPNMTGEATAAYLADRLRGRTRVTRLASGLPVGGDLEYADEVTLGRARSRAPNKKIAAREIPKNPAGSPAAGGCFLPASSVMSNHASQQSSE